MATGVSGEDTIFGTSGSETLNGGAGDDTISGGGGNDRIIAGADDDTVDGGSGSDIVNGDSGNDTLIYTLSENIISGLKTVDTYDGGSGVDTLVFNMTAGEYEAYQAAVTTFYQKWLLVRSVGNGQVSNETVTFSINGGSTVLNMSKVEHLNIYVDGTLVNLGGNDPVVITSGVQAGAVVEDGPALTASGNITFDDYDLADVHVVSIASGPASPLGSLTFVTTEQPDTIGGTAAWTYTLDNAAAQSLAQGQSVTETYTVILDDGNGSTATQTITITVTGVNDAPVAVDDTGAGNEDTLITGSVAGNDTDADDGATLSYALVNAAPAGLTFNPDGSYSLDAANAAYQHLAAGATMDVVVDYTVSDGTASDTGQLTITVTGVNDAPVADLNGIGGGNDATATFTEDAGPALIASAATITDVDDTNMESMTITLTNRPDGSAESLSLDPMATLAALGLTVSAYNASTGELTITGSASKATYEFILRGVQYNNTDQDPNIAARIVNVVVSDGTAVSQVHNSTIMVVPANDAPAVDLNGALAGDDATASFIEQTAVVIAPSATIGDVDSANIASLTATLAARPDGNNVESLSLNATALAAAAGLTVTYVQTTGVLSITGSATKATYQTILEGIQYSNTSDAPDSTPRTVDIVVSDGTDSSISRSVTIGVTPVNDAATDIVFTYTGAPGNSLPNGAFGQMSFVDPDGGAQPYSFSLTGLTATTLAGGAVSNFAGDLTVSSAGVISASGLDDDRVYELTVQVTQGAATFSETFSVITGTNAGETVSGGYASGDDVIFAQGAADTILAGSGNDTVFGQSSDDHIYGGTGNDTLTGGGGNDTFYFDAPLDAASNVDAITDFNANNNDKMALDNAIFSQLTLTGTLSASNFVSNAGGAAVDGDDYILYDTGTGSLFYDADGNGAGAKIQFATLTPTGLSGTVDSNDFLVV